MFQHLNAIPLWIVTLLFAGLICSTVFLGSRLRRLVGTDPAIVASGQLIFGTVTVLSLLVGFTFSLALNRHDLRRDLVLEESNAIRAAHRALTNAPEPGRSVLVASLTRYAKGRLAFVRSNLIEQEALEPRLLAERDEFNRLVAHASLISANGASQTQVLGHATRILDAGTRMEMISFAHVPARVVLMLVLLATGSALMIGISIGDRWPTLLLPIALWSLLLSLALFTIVDLDTPQWGSIRLDPAPLDNAVRALTEPE